MAEDNWKHRSNGMRCGSCIYFVEKTVVSTVAGPAKEPLGRCRRHAPLAGGGGWPAVFASDWCGDHKLDEGKV